MVLRVRPRPRRTRSKDPRGGSPARTSGTQGGRARRTLRRARWPPFRTATAAARSSPRRTRRRARGPTTGSSTTGGARRLSWSRTFPRSVSPQDAGAWTPRSPPAADAAARRSATAAPGWSARGAHAPTAAGAPIGRIAAALATAAAAAAAAAAATSVRRVPRGPNASGTRSTPRACRRAGDGLVEAMRKGRAVLGRRAFRIGTRSAAPSAPVLLAGLRAVGMALSAAMSRPGGAARAKAPPRPSGKGRRGQGTENQQTRGHERKRPNTPKQEGNNDRRIERAANRLHTKATEMLLGKRPDDAKKVPGAAAKWFD